LKFLLGNHFSDHRADDADYICQPGPMMELDSALPFPLQPPARALAMIAIGKLVDTPHSKLANIVQVKPVRIAGLRPNLS
jgi:hypothetical protein